MNSTQQRSPGFISFIQKSLCVLASFEYDRHRQMRMGYAKSLVLVRGLAVLLPSMMAIGTLSLYGREIFGSIGETALLAVIFPLVLFAFDFAFVAQSYGNAPLSVSMIFARFLLLVVLLGLNIFILAGINAGALRADLEQEIRESPVFTEKEIDLKFRENINAEEQLTLIDEISESEHAKKRLPELIKRRDAELYGATLTDGIQRIPGKGTKANGFILEINEASMIAEAGKLASERLEKVVANANSLKLERLNLNAEILQEVKNRQSPGMMVSALIKKCRAGQVDVMYPSLLFLLFLLVIDCSALILSHMPNPQDLKQIVNHYSIINVAQSDIDHEITLQRLNSKRPAVDIKAIPDIRTRYSSAQIYNMSEEAPKMSLSDDELSLEDEVLTEDERDSA